MERLESHTNADDQSVYRSASDLEQALKEADPCAILRSHLLEQHDEEVLTRLEKEVLNELNQAFQQARNGTTPDAVFEAKKPLQDERTEYRGDSSKATLSMLEAMREALRCRLRANRIAPTRPRYRGS